MKIKWVYLILFFLFFSCSHYLGSFKTNSPKSNTDINLISYAKYYLFKYKTSVKATEDTEVFDVTSFEVRLPKKLKFFTFNSFDFGFYYKKKQVIFIKTDLKDSVSKDQIYEPSEKKLKAVMNQLVTYGKDKYDIHQIGENPRKKTWIIRKGRTLILLYNIDKKDIDAYMSLLNSFKTI